MTKHPASIWLSPACDSHSIWERVWDAEKIDGCFKCGARAVEYVRADLVERLIRAVDSERNFKSAYDATPADRGGMNGPKGQAYQLWCDARSDVGAALAAINGGQKDG